MDNQIIIVKQLPIIEEQLQAIKADIVEKVQGILALECTEDNYKSIKKYKADLNKDYIELESRRKEVKKKILAPYEAFESIYKECVTDVFKPANEQLTTKINAVEDKLKADKAEEVRAYFDEYVVAKGIDFVTFEDLDIVVTMSASKKSLKEKVKTQIDKIADDIAMINTQEYAAEIYVEYKKSLNVSQAILMVNERQNAIRAEAERVAQMKAAEAEKAEAEEKINDALFEEFTAPTVAKPVKVVEEQAVPLKKYTAAFKVTTHNIEHLRKIKSVLEELRKDGLIYEQF